MFSSSCLAIIMAMYQFYVLNVHMSKTPPEEVLQGLFSIVGCAKTQWLNRLFSTMKSKPDEHTRSIFQYRMPRKTHTQLPTDTLKDKRLNRSDISLGGLRK